MNLQRAVEMRHVMRENGRRKGDLFTLPSSLNLLILLH